MLHIVDLTLQSGLACLYSVDLVFRRASRSSQTGEWGHNMAPNQSTDKLVVSPGNKAPATDNQFQDLIVPISYQTTARYDPPKKTEAYPTLASRNMPRR
jgi:hypothetical protein